MKKVLTVFICVCLIFAVGCKKDVSSCNSSSVKDSSGDSNKDDSTNSEPSESTTEPPVYEKTDDQLIGEQNKQIDRIVNAYLKKDESLLDNAEDIFILKEATRILNKIVRDGMKDDEKERAVHDYIIRHNTYDTDAFSEVKKINPESYRMYGFFKNNKSVCLGYTRSFQLFMDMLEIPCITIHSYSVAGREREEHAWNMVKLDDKWYHVDVTWDDPVPDNGYISHQFFNVTDKIMADSGHIWNNKKYPSADDEKYINN